MGVGGFDGSESVPPVKNSWRRHWLYLCSCVTMLSASEAGSPVVMTVLNLEMALYWYRDLARNQPRDLTSSLMCSLFLRPVTTQAEKFKSFWILFCVSTDALPKTDMQYLILDSTSELTRRTRTSRGSQCRAAESPIMMPVQQPTTWSMWGRKVK